MSVPDTKSYLEVELMAGPVPVAAKMDVEPPLTDNAGELSKALAI